MLDKPARYFPLERGLYEVAPGLRTLGTDFGNGALDRRIFQIDTEFTDYRASKMECRRERLGKYWCESEFSQRTARAVHRVICEKLGAEYPALFTLEGGKVDGYTLDCKLTGDRLEFTRDWDCVAGAFASGLDALAMQVQEDLAILQRRGDRDWLAAIHLCSPSHWAAEDKIGKNFFDIHAPVPGIEKINRAATSFVDAMIHKGPYVRFVWGFGTDRRLNHHPLPPPGEDAIRWKGRRFDLSQPSPFTLRVERQVIVGLPEVEAALFAIRISFVDGNEIRRDPQKRALLRSALLSMSPESRVYKGVDRDLGAITQWLDN